jgi:hypothetical protein
MAVKLDNLDSVLKQLAKIEGKVDTEIIRAVRKNMLATMRSMVPIARKASPTHTGALVKSVKVKSRSRRGKTKVWVIWTVPYAGPVNFKKDFSDSEGYASDVYDKNERQLDSDGRDDIAAGFKKVLTANGIKVIS